MQGPKANLCLDAQSIIEVSHYFFSHFSLASPHPVASAPSQSFEDPFQQVFREEVTLAAPQISGPT